MAPRDLSLSPINRGFNEAFLNFKTIVQSPTLPDEVDMFEAKRPYYQKELENGIERFFEEPSATCPWCKGGPVNEFIHSRDYIQHKPGEFTLDKCDSCGHVFQNPRLTLDGLNFYYKDFYDGLGGEQIESVFGSLGIHYTRRCNLVAKYIEPQNWLDVGTGHGHFPIAAKQILPGTVFDGLDMSESVEDAVDRGWINKGYLGLFPEIAGTIDNSYDVVSMHHYLEHTRDPLAELDASVKVLKKGGYLLIEVPNPECKWGTILKGKWMPWFQPQHQHMIPRANLEKALEERGFKVVDYEVEDSHQSAELLFAALFTIDSLAPDPRLPWLKPATTKSHIKRKAAFALGVVPVGIGALADKVLEKVVKKKEWSNAYRVLARFDGSSE
ncbi:MAG: methyltransferase domain-containing protein [Acidimicrobiales bacterium]|nr:methyltransferase domain-containing protein [Acidimicrobiales bacterium]